MNGIFWEGGAEENFIGYQLAEIYKDRVFTPVLVSKKDLTIVDLGANVGITSNYLSQFAKKIYAVEPFSEHFLCLTKMIEFNGLGHIITPINKAIYTKNGSFPIGGPSENKTMQSLKSETWKGGMPSEVVSCVTIDTLFDEYKIGHVDLMKIDIEGLETEILSSVGFAKVSDQIDMIVGELHSWAGRHPQQLIDALEARGFDYQKTQGEAQLFFAKKHAR